jgi:hypothetical protein
VPSLQASNSSTTTAAVWGCDFGRQGTKGCGNESIRRPKSQPGPSSLGFSSTGGERLIKGCQASVALHDKRARSGLSFAEADRARCRVS